MRAASRPTQCMLSFKSNQLDYKEEGRTPTLGFGNTQAVAAAAAADAAAAAEFVASAMAAAIFTSISERGIPPPAFNTPTLYLKSSFSLCKFLTSTSSASRLFR